MTDNGGLDCGKLLKVVQCLRKTLQCTLCHKIPTDPVAAKCGHPFCQVCVDKIVNTKHCVCAICKTVIVKSGLRKVESSQKIVADFRLLHEAVEKDTGSILPQTQKQPERRRESLTLLDPTSSRAGTTRSEFSAEQAGTVLLGKRGRPRKVAKQKSIDSEETIKIKSGKATGRSGSASRAEPEAPSARDNQSTPVFTTDKLSAEIGVVGSTEKVKDWLLTEVFESEKLDNADFPEIPAQPPSLSSSESFESLESFSQGIPNMERLVKTQETSKMGNSRGVGKRTRLESEKSEKNQIRYKSFTFEATDGRPKKPKVRDLTPSETIFEELQEGTSNKKLDDKKKAKASAVLTDSSWSELKQLKKETRPNVRKRKRLNLSIERPNLTKPPGKSLDKGDSGEEKEAGEIDEGIEDKKNSRHKETEEVIDSGKKRKKPSVVSDRSLDQSEKLDIELGKLNRRQVKEIIGAPASEGTLEASKNSSMSLEKSLNVSNRSRLSLRRSVENSRDRSNEERHREDLRPESKQSSYPDSRPESRLSHKSQGKRASDKFRLSTKMTSSTPNVSPSSKSLDQNAAVQPTEETSNEKVQLASDSPVRTGNNFIRSKLSLRRLSSGSSKTTDRETKGISITKLGKLYKPRSRIKFYYHGSTRLELVRKELNSVATSSCRLIETRDAQVQTSPKKLTDNEKQNNDQKTKAGKIIPQAGNVSAASTGLKQIEEVGVAGPSSQPMVCRKSPLEESDTGNTVNLLPPEDDSQLKYLTVESPSVPRTSILESAPSSDTVMREQGTDDFSSRVQNYAEDLIVTDSEDQDMPVENLGRIKRSKEAKKIKTKRNSSISRTSSSSVARSRNEEAKTAPGRDVTSVKKSPSSNASPKRKKLLRESSGSRNKRRSAENPESQAKIVRDYREYQFDSDTEIVKLSVPKSKDSSCRMEDSESMSSTTKHKVVRKLDYSQEAGSNCTAQTGRSGSWEREGSLDKEKKKTFQKAPLISSSDSEELVILLTTKESLSTSQTITRPGPSQVCRSPILSEDLSIVFSSNKESQETKRKRSPSPNYLDNNDLKAIAANWCDDLDHSSEEIATSSVSKHGKNTSANVSVPTKKPRIDAQESSMSSGSDHFPILSPTAIYGSRREGKETVENNRSLNNTEKSPLSFAGRITPAKNREVDDLTRPGRNRPDCTPRNTSRRISPVGNTEHLIKRGSSSNENVTIKNSTPRKTTSLEKGELTHQLSHNSDKENELSQQGGMADLRRPKDSTSVPRKTEEKNNMDLFESFDADYLNITQEQLLMQEVEDNLVGRKSNSTTIKKSLETKQDRVPETSASKNKEKTPSKKETPINSSKQKPKGYQIAQINSDDSIVMSEDEDIIDRTPEKNLLSKKDLSAHVDNSQRSNASLKSFMSVDMTPIPNRILQMGSDVSPLGERNSRVSGNQNSLQKNLSIRLSSHSTPKATTSVPKKLNLQNSVKTRANNRDRLCFVCSCLSLAQVENVKAFARMHNVEYTACYKPEVTHVIVETNESDTAGRTLKYLLGVAHKKWIVSYRWVVDCMSEGRLLPEENYEAVDSDSEEPGPQRSRLSKKGLFDEFAFVCMRPFSDITIVQLQDLITSTGGIVLETLEELASVSDRHKVILYNGDVHQPEVLDNWRARGRALPVQVEWVLSCISQYYLMSFRDFLDSPDSDLVLEMGFPAELIVEEDDSAIEASTLQIAQ